MSQSTSSSSPPPPPPPPPAPAPLVFPIVDVWNNPQEYEIRYVVGTPWTWVMDRVKTPYMQAVAEASALPLAQQQQQAAAAAATTTTTTTQPTPRQQRRQRTTGRNKALVPATLRMEIVQADNRVVVAWHGTSSAFDGLEDKDALVRTIQRCRAEEFQLAPPSVLITWDVSLEECRNVIGPNLPTVAPHANNSNQQQNAYAVLKEPMGTQGKGIYFVRDIDEIHQIIDSHHQKARDEPDVLESLIAAKNRIPSWVLQAEVSPCLLIRQGRKFHIRSYVVLIERPENDEILDLYLYHEHEVRIAGVPIDPNNHDDRHRNRLAHVTNGALSSNTERTLMSAEPELAHLQPSLEVFIAEIFAKHLLTDISRRVTGQTAPAVSAEHPVREFAVAGLDLMVTTSGRWYLLEVNVNPGAPTKAMATEETFGDHMMTFWKSMINLVAGQSTDGFYDAFAVLERAGVTAS